MCIVMIVLLFLINGRKAQLPHLLARRLDSHLAVWTPTILQSGHHKMKPQLKKKEDKTEHKHINTDTLPNQKNERKDIHTE